MTQYKQVFMTPDAKAGLENVRAELRRLNPSQKFNFSETVIYLVRYYFGDLEGEN